MRENIISLPESQRDKDDAEHAAAVHELGAGTIKPTHRDRSDPPVLLTKFAHLKYTTDLEELAEFVLPNSTANTPLSSHAAHHVVVFVFP